MFRRLEQTGTGRVAVIFDGRTIEAAAGESLAAALLAAGVTVFRQIPVSDRPRGPFCMMGACFDCLVEIDGRVVQACMTPVRDGLVVRRAHGTSGENA